MDSGKPAIVEVVCKIFLNTEFLFLFICLCKCQIFIKRQGIDTDLYISAGKKSRQITGKQPGIGACYIDITVKIYPERVDCFFPSVYFLYLIQKYI